MAVKHQFLFILPLSIALLVLGLTGCTMRPSAPVATPTPLPPAVATLNLQGAGGDDVFNLTGALPYTGTIVDADATVNLTGATGPVSVNLDDSTIPTSSTRRTDIDGFGTRFHLRTVQEHRRRTANPPKILASSAAHSRSGQRVLSVIAE